MGILDVPPASPGTYTTAGAFSRAMGTVNSIRQPRGVSRTEAEQRYRDALYLLRTGGLQTAKAAQTGKTLRFAAPGGTSTLKWPDYQALTAGLGDNTAITADKGWVSAVTHVYNLTADSTRTTDILSSYNNDTEAVVVTTTPALNDDIEVQCTYVPYQGIASRIPVSQTAQTHMTFEALIVDFPFYTSAGTGGTHFTGPYVDLPLIPKLPLPSVAAGNRDSSYLNDSVVWIGGAGSPSGTRESVIRENVLPQALSAKANLLRFRPGLTFNLAGAAERGFQQTNPQTQEEPPIITGTNPRLMARFSLVRAYNMSVENDDFIPGRLYICCYVAEGLAPNIATTSASTNAIDVYRLPNDPDYFEGPNTWI